ncbi:MAG: PAS domain S-box protein [Chloroflexi bacterium]|nr:PAS domain S-box protein [Chloroflexota bacterium]
MNLALTPYLFTLLLSVTITWFLAFYIWRQRQMIAAIPFTIIMFSAGIWALFYAFELIVVTQPEKVFWFNFKQIGGSTLGPSLLFFALQYTNRRVKYPKLLWLLLLFEPIGSQIIFWTNSAHGLGGTPRIVLDALPFPLLAFEYGSWYWFTIFVGYFLFSITIMIFLTQLLDANKIYRKQISLVLIGLLLPWFGNVLSLLGVWGLDVLDVTPFLFPISGLFMALSLFRYKLLGLSPVAYTAVLSSIRDGIIILDDNFRILELNPAALRLLGRKERSLIGHPLAEVLPIWDDMISDKTPFEPDQTVEFYYEHGGQYRYLEAHSANVVNKIHVATGHVLILYDVTKRKLAEQLLERRATNLEVEVRSEQERSAIILQNVKDAIAVSDLAFRIIYVNKAFSTFTGYSEEEAPGKLSHFFINGRIPKPLRQPLQKAIREASSWEGELQLLRKNGTVYDATVLIAAMRDGNGQLIGYMISHRDITQSKRLEKARRQFVSNVSHQLRTPVTNIKLYADLLQRNFDTSRKEQYFKVLTKQIARLETIIQNILEFSYLEDKQQKQQWQPLNWKNISQDLQSQLQSLATDKAIQLKFKHTLTDLTPYYGDPQQITQILHEMILNAIIFSPSSGQIIVSSEIQIDNSQKWLTISVNDKGVGIPVAEQDLIFDRFYRGKAVRAGQIPGTGLGLSTANLIAQAHNGRIVVKSELDQGSTFTLWLPIS